MLSTRSIFFLTAACSIGALIGYCVMIPVRGKRLEHWRGIQARYAQQDLQLLRELHLDHDFLFRDGVEPLIAKGELRWEEPSSNDTHLHPVWTKEPNGFERMRMTLGWIDERGSPKVGTLVRRFSDAEIRNSVGTGMVAMTLSGIAGLLLASLVLIFGHLRRNELRSLQASNQALLDEQIGAIRSSYENSSLAMTSMPIGILSFDRSLVLNFINPAGNKLLGLENASEGQKLFEILRAPAVLDCIQETHRTGRSQEIEYERASEKTWLRLRTHPLRLEPSNAPLRHVPSKPGSLRSVPVLLTVIDETRLKQLENLRRDFTANVSHELKTPLAAIKAYAETLLMGASEEPETCRRFVERIAEQAGRLDALIRDLLQLTRLQSQPDKPKLYELDLVEIIQRVMEDHRAIAAKNEVTLSIDSPKSLLVVSDRESMQTVINNLMSNAIRYNRSGGRVSVVCRIESEGCVVEIADTGIGIPPGDLARIFERFYRVEKGRSQDQGGTGLGLAIVKHLCQSIEAEVQVHSQVGTGTAFTVRFPQSVKSPTYQQSIDRRDSGV